MAIALQRMPELPSSDDVALKAFRTECLELLSYRLPLAKNELPDDLRKVLTRLGLLPLTPESVAAYKQQLTQSPWWGMLAILGCFVGLGMLIGGGVLVASGAGSWIVPVCAAGVLVVSVIAAHRLDEAAPDGSWELAHLAEYSKIGQVPEFALQTAMDLVKAYAKGDLVFKPDFYVEHLTHHQDPFLVLYYAGNRYWLEVWNEPKFKQRRMV